MCKVILNDCSFDDAKKAISMFNNIHPDKPVNLIKSTKLDPDDICTIVLEFKEPSDLIEYGYILCYAEDNDSLRILKETMPHVNKNKYY